MAEKSSTPDGARPDPDATTPFERPEGPDATAPTDDATAPLEPGTEPTRPMTAVPGPDATRADAWTGRAEVRGPIPPEDTEEWTDQEPEEPGRRWWLPILLGLLGVLAVLAAIVAAIMLTNRDTDVPVPVPTRTAVPTPSIASPSAQPSPTPSASPSPATVLVPETSGDTLSVASGKLSALGLVVHVTYQEDPLATPGTVLGSVPTAGSEVPSGSDITLIVAQAMASSSPPAPASSAPALQESLSPAPAQSQGD